MKKFLIAIFVASLFLSACGTEIRKIGSVNLISVRNTDTDGTQKYEKLAECAGCTEKEKKSNKALSLEDALDNLTHQYAGGEYVQNVRLFVISSKYFAAEGDVYGVKLSKAQRKEMHSFSINDGVKYKDKFGKIVSVDLKTKKAKINIDGRTKEVNIAELQMLD